MKLSIIVPIYNTEKYLRKCVDSILAQTLTDFECILVDDGSTDNCPAICDEYAEKDPRIVVIHKPNGGLSDARNAGLDIAKGDYIGFVDSDDWIETEMYNTLYSLAISNSSDISSCQIMRIFENKKMPYPISQDLAHHSKMLLTSTELLSSYERTRLYLHTCVWNKIFKKHLFDNIFFPVGKLYEDEFIILDILDRCKNIVITEKIFYNYRQRVGSILNSTYRFSCSDQIEVQNRALDFFKRKKLKPQYYFSLVRYVNVYIANNLAIYTHHKNHKKHFYKFKKQAKKYIPEVLKNPHICKLLKIVFCLTFISPKLALVICKKYFSDLIL